MTTTIDSPEITRSEITRIVMAAHPGLIAAMERAGEEFYENEDAWQEEAARHQRNAGMPKRSLESPYGKVLNEASAAVVEAFEAMLASGTVVYAGNGRPGGG